MARFVSVNAYTPIPGQHEEVWVNLASIRSIKRSSEGATIDLTDGTGLVVTDSPEDLFAKAKIDA